MNGSSRALAGPSLEIPLGQRFLAGHPRVCGATAASYVRHGFSGRLARVPVLSGCNIRVPSRQASSRRLDAWRLVTGGMRNGPPRCTAGWQCGPFPALRRPFLVWRRLRILFERRALLPVATASGV